MRKKLLIIAGAIALFALAHLFRTLDTGAATHTAGIRGVQTEVLA